MSSPMENDDGSATERVIPMNSVSIKKVVAVLVAALVLVVGAIYLVNSEEKKTQAAATVIVEATATPVPQVTTEPTMQPQESAQPQEAAQESETSADNEAQDEAQGTMYEGALAGLTEEEIAKMALAEEQSHRRTDDTGAEDAVD